MKNWVNPTTDPKLVACGTVSYVLFHKWLLREDILLSSDGADKICIQTILGFIWCKFPISLLWFSPPLPPTITIALKSSLKSLKEKQQPLGSEWKTHKEIQIGVKTFTVLTWTYWKKRNLQWCNDNDIP